MGESTWPFGKSDVTSPSGKSWFICSKIILLKCILTHRAWGSLCSLLLWLPTVLPSGSPTVCVGVWLLSALTCRLRISTSASTGSNSQCALHGSFWSGGWQAAHGREMKLSGLKGPLQLKPFHDSMNTETILTSCRLDLDPATTKAELQRCNISTNYLYHYAPCPQRKKV